MSFPAFLYSQLFVTLPYPATSFAGRTIIVTGANVGLGKEAARHFVRLGASKLILAVRNLDKGFEAKRDIEKSTRCADDVLEVWHIDMGSYASVQSFAARVNSTLERLDVFVANAGVAPAKYSVLEDNEASITVNALSTFLLTALVMPMMRRTAAKFDTRPTLTIVTSEVHGHTSFSQRSAPDGGILAAVGDKDIAESLWGEQYPISKLFQVFGVRALADRYPNSLFPVTINCVNPGLCHSELGRDFPGFGFWLIKTLLARSTEMGSRALVHAASQGPETHGQYLSDSRVASPSAFVMSEEGKKAQIRVWAELVQKLETVQPGIIGSSFGDERSPSSQ